MCKLIEAHALHLLVSLVSTLADLLLNLNMKSERFESHSHRGYRQLGPSLKNVKTSTLLELLVTWDSDWGGYWLQAFKILNRQINEVGISVGAP